MKHLIGMWIFVCILLYQVSAVERAAWYVQDSKTESVPFSKGPTPSKTPALPDEAAMKKRLDEISREQRESADKGTTDHSRNMEAGSISIMPQHPGEAMQDPATRNSYLASLREYYNYRISGYQHRQRVFGWQLLAAKVIFFTVLALVFAGIYFAAIQFNRGLKAGEKTEMSASLHGITVSSPVLGVVILVISFAFFYLYLVYVYPIAEIF